MGLAAGIIASVAIGTGGCRGEDITFDCENQHMTFNKRVSELSPPLRADIPAKGPFPVAVQLTSTGIRKLLANVIDEGVPFSGSIPFGVLPQGPADADIKPSSTPQILLKDVPNCPNCVVFHLDFDVRLASGEKPLSSGAGYVDLNIPLRLDADAATGNTTLVAEYGKATIGDWFISVYGFDSNTHTMLSGALKVLMGEQITENYDDVELFTLGSWSIGKGNVKLVARDLQVYPELDKIVLGMHTNLPLPASVSVDTSLQLPPTTVMTVSMAPGLFAAMAQRMFDEGEIARHYDENGKPDPGGIYGITLDDIAADAQGEERLLTTFDVWRVADGYCGYVRAEMPMGLATDMAFQKIVVTPGEATLIEGKGSGAAALEEQELVDQNKDLISRFRDDLAEQIGKTVNYEALSIEDSDIVFTTQGIDVEPGEMRTYIDVLVLAEE